MQRQREGVSWTESWLLGSPCHCTASNQCVFFWRSQLCSLSVRQDSSLLCHQATSATSRRGVLLTAEEHISGVITGLISSTVVMTAFILPDVLGDRMQLREIIFFTPCLLQQNKWKNIWSKNCSLFFSSIQIYPNRRVESRKSNKVSELRIWYSNQSSDLRLILGSDHTMFFSSVMLD